MNSLQLNLDLLAYMKKLAADLNAGGALDDAYRIADASKFASGSASEFLHEARNALAGLSQSHEKGLTAAQMEDLRSVIRQIDYAFRKIGGHDGHDGHVRH